MDYKFKDACIEVHLSTIVEHYQTLMRAVETSDWDDVWCVMECLSENISYGIQNAKTDFKFTPSPTSLLPAEVWASLNRSQKQTISQVLKKYAEANPHIVVYTGLTLGNRTKIYQKL